MNKKKTMKVTIDKIETVELEVQLPMFTKDKNYYYKICDKKTIIVNNSEFESSITIHDYMSKYPLAYEQISEQEFNNVFILLINKLNDYAK